MAAGREYDVLLEEIAREGLYDQIAFPLPGDAIPGEAMTWVTGTINGRHFEANTSPEEQGRHLVFVPIELRQELGVGAGDQVHVVIDPPEERPEVAAPVDLREALAAAGAGLDFEQLTAGQRREYVTWVDEATGEERADRLKRAAEGIRDRRPPREVTRPT